MEANDSLREQEEEYATFKEKVKRTVYLDNLSPLVTIPILKNALGQFGVVSNVQILPNYLEANNVAINALVEMQTEHEAANTVTEITTNVFMIAGMPRPVRAMKAKIEMFPDPPALPGRRIQCCWINSNDPHWNIVLSRKHLAMKHSAETAQLLKYQREEEEKLGAQQEATLRSSYKKLELIESLANDGSLDRLSRRYNPQHKR
ncbi:hypothetical protein SUGI_0288940 [Cryptomeria japonica]|uniref:uncharacterized protein LOC131027823 n=1 Tax=Cryptomeria japonica TaxID=3369 RepID=UPI00240896DC|nr:uncharacterized protein LOC131027823 [Cryptomeria japonica]GLJ16779.1 hypothetical protein SUGI_0288940 [Cryptomeria japonica]